MLLCLIFMVSASAQMADISEAKEIKTNNLGLQPASKPFSLIDLSRLNFSHSYSFAFFSGGGSSGSVGLYTGNIFYELSSSLSLNIQLGVAHNPSALFDRMQSSNALFLPGATVDYHPSDNFRITAGFNTHYGNNYYPFNSFYNPGWRR